MPVLDLIHCHVVAIIVVTLILLVAANTRRLRRAQQGAARLLLTRSRILRVYHRRRDGRVYDPDRNPELADILADKR